MSASSARALQPSIPTYKTAAAVLERQTGSGLMLAAWTVARTLLIAPPMMIVGVEPRRAIIGAALASSLISSFALLKLYNAGPGHHGVGRPTARPLRRRPAGPRRRPAPARR